MAAPTMLKLSDDLYIIRALFAAVWIVKPSTDTGTSKCIVLVSTTYGGAFTAGEFDPFDDGIGSIERAHELARVRLTEIVDRVNAEADAA